MGNRIRRLRQAKGYSRSELARRLKIDVSSLAGWEAGTRLPRDSHRARLARMLDCDLAVLFCPETENIAPLKAKLIDTLTQLPQILAERAKSAQTLRAARLASPYPTAAYIQTEWRAIIAERILADAIQVQRLEIVYNLKRLQEVLSNILRYDGHSYHVKAHCTGVEEIVPTMGGYVFDDWDFFLGGYWSSVPPRNYPVLRLSGPMMGEFFLAFWAEVWPRGTLLNIRGAHDLSAVRDLALKLGLKPRQWTRFVEEARALDIGDGAPPLI